MEVRVSNILAMLVRHCVDMVDYHSYTHNLNSCEIEVSVNPKFDNFLKNTVFRSFR